MCHVTGLLLIASNAYMPRTLVAALLLVVLLGGCGGAEWTNHTLSADPSPSPAGEGTSATDSSGPAAQTESDTTVLGSWSAIPSAPIQGRDYFTWVWTGTEVLIWGGLPGPTALDDHRVSDGSDGAAYVPATGNWRLLPPAPLAGRFAHIAAWTGHEMLVWGGVSTPDGRIARPDGAAYDPVTNTWRRITPSPIHRTGTSVGVWTGSRWVVVDGLADDGGRAIDLEAAAYDPAADAWTTLPGLHLPAAVSASITWTGSDVLFVENPDAGHDLGFRLQLGDASWRPTAPAPFDGIFAAQGIWTGAELLVPASFVKVDPAGDVSDRLFGYDPAADVWRASSLPPTGMRSLEGVWTGRYVVFYSGIQPAVAYEATSDRWLELPATVAGQHEAGYTLWAGDRIVAWGGGEGESFLRPADGLQFVPEDTP